jgi:ribosomally synthesized peptide (two-chain TOMM family)
MPRNNELPSYESLLEYQEVYLRAVALAWTDKEFKQAFVDNPRSALEMYFGYSCPWNVEIQVIEPKGPEYGWNAEKRQWSLPRMKATFGLPVAPKIEEQLVAFAAYNDAGPSYLFTCC